MVDRDAIIQSQRSDWKIQTQTDAPVIIEIAEIVIVRVCQHVADVIEHGKTNSDTAFFFLLKDGDAVFGGTEPVRVPANRLAETGLARADSTGNIVLASAALSASAQPGMSLVGGSPSRRQE